MADPLGQRPNRNIAPFLAAMVLLGGVGACVGIMLISGETGPAPIGVAVGGAFAFGLLLWSLRDRPVAQQRSWYSWVFHRPRQRHVSVEVRSIRPRAQFGTNQPPTLEQLKQLKDDTRTWVPSQGRGGRPSPTE